MTYASDQSLRGIWVKLEALRLRILNGDEGQEMKAMQLHGEQQREQARSILTSGAVTFEAANAYLWRYCDSYQRLPEVLAFKATMNPREWWRLLGEAWTMCDNLAMHTEELRRCLRDADRKQLDAMMTRYERRRLRMLAGGELTVYRGCYDCNRDGLSWSLSERIARGFPTLNRYRREGDVPLILVGKTDPKRAVLKTDRKEQELICADVRVTSETELTV